MGRTRRTATLTKSLALLASFPWLALTGCSLKPVLDFKPPVVCRHTGPLTSSLFLIGDAGQPKLPDSNAADPDALVDPVLVALRNDVAASVERIGADRTAVVVLGDNVYPAGMPPPGEQGHEQAARILDAQIAAVGEARGLFTLGNHDWDQGKRSGWARANAQYEYLASRGANISLHPPRTCAGPDDMSFGAHLYLIFFDVWAANYQIQHPDGPQSHCTPAAGEGRLAKLMDRMLGDTGDRRTIMITHPPMLTSGPHGGYFPWREHLFPLRTLDRNLWIPLPIIGSLFPLARLLGVTDTDVMSSSYQLYLEAMRELITPGHPTLVVAGHEHSLQVHIDPDGVFHAVSGAGSSRKVDYVREMNSDLMALAAPGYMRLDVYDDASLRLNVLAVEGEGRSKMVFSTCIP